MTLLESISVIIPIYNEYTKLKATMESLERAIEFFRFKSKNEIEVIITDDGSTDGSGEFITQHFSGFKYFWHENLGRGPNRNWGARHSNADILVFLDADIVLERDAIWNLIQALKPSGQNQICFGKIGLVSSANPHSLEVFLLSRWDKYLSRFAELQSPWDGYSCYFAMWSQFFNSLNGFSSEAIFKKGADDTEFFVRAARHGAMLQFVESAVGLQDRKFDLKSNLNRKYWSSYAASLVATEFGEEILEPKAIISSSPQAKLFKFVSNNHLWRYLKFFHGLIDLFNIKGKIPNYFYTYLFNDYSNRGCEDARKSASHQA